MDVRIPWATAQGVVSAAMVVTIFYTVTGFLWWLAINVAAGISGVVAIVLVRRSRRRAAMACYVAGGLFIPINLLFGIGNLLGAAPHWIPVSWLVIAAAQAALVLVAWTWTGSTPTIHPDIDQAK